MKQGQDVLDRHSRLVQPLHTSGGTIGAQMPVIDNVNFTANFTVVHKDYVLDYTSPLQHVIMEMESGDGVLTHCYTCGLQKDSAGAVQAT
jgi:hypothetical protein